MSNPKQEGGIFVIIMATFMISVVLLSLIGLVFCIFIGIYTGWHNVVQSLSSQSTSDKKNHQDVVTVKAVETIKLKPSKKKRRHAKKSSKSKARLSTSGIEDTTQTKTVKYSKPSRTSKSYQYDSSTMEDEPLLYKPNIAGGSGQTVEIKGFTKDDIDIAYGDDAAFICFQAKELEQVYDEFVMDECLLETMEDAG